MSTLVKGEISAIHLDAVGGVAGDMFAAALLDARPDLWHLCQRALDSLNLPEGVAACTQNLIETGFAGARFQVDLPPKNKADFKDHVPWCEIREDIQNAQLITSVREKAIAIFSILADAEAAVHGIAADKVTFHEIGAVDSIIDIVIGAVLIDALEPCRWSIGALPRGRGLVNSHHGFLPLPAPATAEILRGFSLVDDGEEGERITPTGAAILKYLGPTQTPDPMPRTLLGAGIGFGNSKLKSRANMLRATFYGRVDAGLLSDNVEVLRCEIDDQSSEELAIAIECLRKTDGVLDICQWPVYGKKGRIATALQVLVRPVQSEAIITHMLNETETLGVRCQQQRRIIVDRYEMSIDGIRVKLAQRPDRITAKAEIDDISVKKTTKARLELKRRTEAKALVKAKNNGG